jgi:hypothetical protein
VGPSSYLNLQTMPEGKKKADQILNELGAIDGRKHIYKILYFVENVQSKVLVTYWQNVETQFNYAINNTTSN